MKRIAFRHLALVSLGLAVSCTKEAPPPAPPVLDAQPEPVPEPQVESAPEPEPELTAGPPKLIATPSSEAADALAGFPVGTWATGEAKVALEAYAAALEDDWEKWDVKVGNPMMTFAEGELPASDGKTVFYPFSGPDFPTVHRLFPEADRFVLVAMQKAGPPPEPEALSIEDLQETLGVYEQVFANYTRKGFFITTQMNDSFGKDRPVKGLTGLMMAFAAREGYHVEAVDPIWISREGVVEPDPGDRGRLRTWDSVRLTLIRRSDGKKVLLDYLRLNLADRRIEQRPYAMKWVESVAGQLVFVKAASHLMQQTNFKFIRDALLDNAEAILQDESGVGYSDLIRAHDVTLFGSFKKVNKLFHEEPQVPLADAYRERDDVRPLPFRIGYLKAAGSCLQLARPRAAAAATSAPDASAP